MNLLNYKLNENFRFRWQEVKNIKDTTYTLTKLKKSSEHKFRVTALNGVGRGPVSDESAFIKITAPVSKEPPVITEPLADITIGLNKIATLSCVIGGVPTPTIRWFKNNKEIKTTTITYENRIAKYIIENTTGESEGSYSCRAENEVGKIETSCTVKIQEKPVIQIDEKLIIQKLRVSTQYVIDAQISGFPAPDIEWFKDGIKLNSSKERSIKIEKTSSTFIISSLERSDSGRYVIIAKNAAGSSQVELTLKVIDKPSKPEGPMLFREISTEAVVIEWKPPTDDGGLEISQYSIEKCDPTQKAWIKVADVDSEIESYCIQKLLDSAQYLFRVVASNSIGSSEPLESDPITIKKNLGISFRFFKYLAKHDFLFVFQKNHLPLAVQSKYQECRIIL